MTKKGKTMKRKRTKKGRNWEMNRRRGGRIEGMD
jgi:hypothetical protein